MEQTWRSWKPEISRSKFISTTFDLDDGQVDNIFRLMKFWKRRCEAFHNLEKRNRRKNKLTLNNVLDNLDDKKFEFEDDEEKEAVEGRFERCFEEDVKTCKIESGEKLLDISASEPVIAGDWDRL